MPRGEDRPTSHLDDESLARLAAESPSLVFLRDLAHVSDRPPHAFDARISADGEAGDRPVGAPARFLVRRRLGAGAFGIVYEALDQERHATVALKALRRTDWWSISRFKHEFRSLVETVHQNLVQLYELHADGDLWFFTMELVRGTDVISYARAPGGSYDEPRLRAALRQLATGLRFLHDSGKVHRDLKPSNVMVTEEGRVVIVDFGLVHDATDLRTVQQVYGTPAYMAPEQAAGMPVGAAADWYAVGVMLHQALTGRLPSAHDARSPRDPEASPLAPLGAGVPCDLDQLRIELLAWAPELRPTGREVLRRMTPGAPAAPAAPREEPADSGEAPFIGRQTHLQRLHDALAAAEAGGTVVVLLEGRSGMGKSALAQRFVAEVGARTPARLVLSGRCFEQESVPYKGIDGLIEDLCDGVRRAAERSTALPEDLPMLTRLFPQLQDLPGFPRASPPEEDDPLLRPRAFAALRGLLAWAAPGAPVLLVEDLQWGDLDGTALLGGLLHGARPMLLVTTCRAEESETNPNLLAFFATLRALQRGVDVRHLEVGPLNIEEATSLSRAMLTDDRGGAPPEVIVQALVAEAQGDPFLLTELARRDPEGSGGLPQLGALLMARISRLPEAARRLLEVVALDGQPVERTIAAQAAGGGASDTLGALSLLRARRLIRSRRTEAGLELLPYHDRVRELVVHGLDSDTCREHHRRLAWALEAAGAAEPERLLFHHRGAGQVVEAARCAAEAARRAHEALAFDRAARLYREALELGAAAPGGPADTDQLRAALAEALAGAMRPREAALAWLEAARGAAPAEASARSRRAAELLLGAGYVDEGLATLRGVARDLHVPLSSSLPCSLLGFAWLRLRLGARGLSFRERPESTISKRELLRVDASYAAAIGLFLTNPVFAAESQARHLLLALDTGEPLRVARALAFEAVFTTVRRGAGAEVEHLLSMARSIERRGDHPHLTGFLRLCECQIMQISTRWRLAYELAVESESVLRRRCAGVSLEMDLVRFRRTDLLWNLGEVREMSRVVPTIVAEARERGSRFLEMMVQLSSGSLLRLVEDRPDGAREVVAEVLARWPSTPGSIVHVREIRAQARIALYEGRGREAIAWIEEGLAAMRRTGLIFASTQTAELRILRALAALSVGDDAGAARHTRRFARLGFAWTKNHEPILRAGLARRAGDLEGAMVNLDQARGTALAHGAALYAAAMSRRLGVWRGGEEGRAQVAAADAEMARQGIADPERMTGMMLGWT